MVARGGIRTHAFPAYEAGDLTSCPLRNGTKGENRTHDLCLHIKLTYLLRPPLLHSLSQKQYFLLAHF